MSWTKIEFAVRMTCQSCVSAVQNALTGDQGIKNVQVNLDNGAVVLETTLPVLEVQKKLETTGRQVVVRGLAGSVAGVAIVNNEDESVTGVVRFVQVSPTSCIIDGCVDGWSPNTQHEVTVHECGDLSQGCASVGDIFNPIRRNTDSREYGHLGTVKSEGDGRVAFRVEDNVLKLSDVIGRSLLITDKDGKTACGIIARSAGLFQNPKTICACDGLTIWNEKTKSTGS